MPDNEGTFVPNELDKRLRKTRIQYMIDIVNICGKLPNMEFKSVLEELENFEKNLEYLEKEVYNTERTRKYYPVSIVFFYFFGATRNMVLFE